jgi:hypothetical protein
MHEHAHTMHFYLSLFSYNLSISLLFFEIDLFDGDVSAEYLILLPVTGNGILNKHSWYFSFKIEEWK